MTGVVVRFEDYRKRAPRPEPPREAGPLTVAEAIEVCLRHPSFLTEWEDGFLTSIRRFRRLSPRQLERLEIISDKVCRLAGRRAP
jgi:hypothetical protein